MDYFMNFAIGFIAGAALAWFFKPKAVTLWNRLVDRYQSLTR